MSYLLTQPIGSTTLRRFFQLQATITDFVPRSGLRGKHRKLRKRSGEQLLDGNGAAHFGNILPRFDCTEHLELSPAKQRIISQILYQFIASSI